MADTDDSREKRRAYKREWKRAWSAANREQKNADLRTWRANNPEKAREASRKHHLRERGNPRAAYNGHRSGAKRRDIAFLLTFEEWWEIWEASGKWDQRGMRKGQYVMARFGDLGPYTVGNVRICTSGENLSEAHLGKQVSAETLKRMSAAGKAQGPISDKQRAALAMGRGPCTPERRAKLIATLRSKRR